MAIYAASTATSLPAIKSFNPAVGGTWEGVASGRPPGSQTSVTKLIASGLTQQIDKLTMDLHGYDGLQLPAERPLYGNSAPAWIGHRDAQTAAASYLNSRAWTIFGGTDEVQKNIIAKTVLEL